MAASAIEDLLEHTDPNTSYYSGVWADVPGKLRAAMLQAEPVTTTNKLGNSPTPVPSREKFISLCNEFWNWSEMDLVCADDRGYELRMEWNGKVFSHPITQALWRMYQAAPGNSPVIPDTWISVSERMPENKPGSYEYLVFETLNNRVNHDYWNVPDTGDDTFTPFWNHYGEYVTHWQPLPAAPQEASDGQ
ncbi:DUF551 domain-containing protein [Klebsiella aerogenes]|nr:DUF551 domain-containing protein [Klebsiella aerogenes]MBS7084094.1 DUF551 domain-containing protein [Klebsiella aerogenes]RSW99244.1 DUF551 domain-containing protein [Klebsiella aerogenes]HCM6137223.1 DUF551 domain-containing protein [Klebsiella aerogenes]HDN2630610.1 DUF551 domain-containing protein [Klebsiella aerogenes]